MTFAELNANAQKWVKALRSGRFQQAQGQLRVDTPEGFGSSHVESRFCCLGVACELYREEVQKDPEAYAYDRADVNWVNDYSSTPMFLEHEIDLPIEVKNWLGLNDVNGAFLDPEGKFDIKNARDGHPKSTLAKLNDEDKSFQYIADVIEAKPEGLFKD